MRDPYDVLGLTRSASEAEVKRAYRKLAKSNHPDSHAGDAKAEARAQAKLSEINGAYEILGDKAKRAQFDRGEIDAEGKPRFQGFEGFRGGGQPGQGAGFENVDPQAFADILSGFGRGGGGGGSSRTYRFTGGSRSSPGGQEDLLSSILGGLGGRGRGSSAQPPGSDVRGEVAVTLEEIADGTRPKVSLPTGKTVALTLPRGVSDGQVIRLQGQGQASVVGGAAGDALVTVRIVPHPLFKLEGADLRLDLPVSLDEAVLGARIAVPTLSGQVNVTVPAHSSSGRVLRLKGKGLPKASGQGDLLVTPRIVLPDNADPELDALMQRWREEGRSSPRGPAYD